MDKNNRKLDLSFLSDNSVTIIFVLFTLFGFAVSTGVSVNFFLTELSARLFRNGLLVLSLIIPVVAGLGLNFGIVVGAMAGQIAITLARYYGMGGVSGLLFCFAVSGIFAAIFGYFTGKLYNKTKGQEMITSIIVSFFANGIYLFLFLFVVGVIIPVPASHPLIKPDGIGIRMSVDLVAAKSGGLKYALDNIWQVPFMWAVLVISICILGLIVYRYFQNKKKAFYRNNNFIFGLNVAACLVTIGISTHAIITHSSLMKVGKVPMATGLVIIAFCIFTELILKTKLGQDFRSVGQSQHISEISGINVNRTRVIAVIISTVLASWGQIIYLQNMGTLNTYNAHTQIGMFSVAALLVGGASTSKANIKHAIIGTILFNSMFIMSPEIGQALFGQALLGEYFRTFMVYGVIGMALGLYVWKANKKTAISMEE